MAALIGQIWETLTETDTETIPVHLSLAEANLKNEQFRIRFVVGKKEYELIFELSEFLNAFAKTVQE